MAATGGTSLLLVQRLFGHPASCRSVKAEPKSLTPIHVTLSIGCSLQEAAAGLCSGAGVCRRSSTFASSSAAARRQQQAGGRAKEWQA